MVAKHVYMGLSCMAVAFHGSLINNQKEDFYANLISESWEGKRKSDFSTAKTTQN